MLGTVGVIALVVRVVVVCVGGGLVLAGGGEERGCAPRFEYNKQTKQKSNSTVTMFPIHQYETRSGGTLAVVLALTIVQLAQLKAQASAIIGLSHAAVTLTNVSHRPPAPTKPHCWSHNRSLSVSSLSINAEQGVGEVVGREEGGAEEIVGLTEGLAVGLTVFALGLDVGSLVGLAVGVAVGFTVGNIVGFAVGIVVGMMVGLAVGLTVGLAVGLTMGLAVGSAVGEVVGLMVGPIVGEAVGPAVGDALGAGLPAVRQSSGSATLATKIRPW